MDGIEKITGRIEADAEREIEAIQAQARAQEYADSHYQGKEVQIRQTGGEMGDGAFRATFTLTCEQDIAQEQAVQR